MTSIRRAVRPIALLALLLGPVALPACGGDDDGGGGGGPDADPGVPADYMEPCSLEPDNCVEPEMCFMFNAKGPHCTHACEDDDDCAAPSTGCSGMGVCKAP